MSLSIACHFALSIISVSIVEETGARMFGLDDAEVVKRRRYVQQVRRELEVRTS